ncbi:hypothetical protein GCM10027589_26860 [Actinocorallia lasiicapitis]
MSARFMKWCGASIFLVSVIGLILYFSSVGLDKADKIASTVGLVVALISLAVTVYGMISDSVSGGTAEPESSVRNEIGSGVTIHGMVVQGHDIGRIDLAGPRPPSEGERSEP